MKRLVLAALLAVPGLMAWALSLPKVGSIDYTEGSVSIDRNGTALSAPDLGDPIVSGDLIKTQGDGTLVMAMDKNTGMDGKITVQPNSALYINVDEVKGEPRTQIQILTGAIGAKASKIAGSPSVNVITSSAVMAVRGTEYQVIVSINADDEGPDSQQATLVTCTENQVSVDDGQGEVMVSAGKVLEKRPGERLRFLPVAISSVKDFGRQWLAAEIGAFRADAPRALANYAKRYADLSAKFEAAYEPFQKSPTPRMWAQEDRAGAAIDPLDPAELREKKEIAGYLFNIRKVLFVFERVYYRMDQISDLIAGTPDETREVRPGLTAGAFLQSVRADRDRIAGEVARFRYVEALFAKHSPEGGAFSGMDDFFSSPSGF